MADTRQFRRFLSQDVKVVNTELEKMSVVVVQ